MKMSRQTAFRVAALIVSITAFLLSPEFHRGRAFEAKQREAPRPGGKYARTAPVSGRLITVRYTQDDDSPVEASQFEGGLIRVELGKSIYGFSPVVTDPASETVTMKVYRIGRIRGLGDTGHESREEVEDLVISKAPSIYPTTYTDADASFTLELLQIQTAPSSELYDQDVIGGCCAECGGRTTCACAVHTACGGCCDFPCCR